jgi:hypothetical protein
MVVPCGAAVRVLAPSQVPGYQLPGRWSDWMSVTMAAGC